MRATQLALDFTPRAPAGAAAPSATAPDALATAAPLKAEYVARFAQREAAREARRRREAEDAAWWARRRALYENEPLLATARQRAPRRAA